MLVLGIESSCDETAAAVVEDGRKVLSSQVFSQIETHKVFGGVVPEIAAREHLKVIQPMVQAALDEASCTLEDIDAIAVTQGPGLVGALLVGITYAKGLALGTGKPLIPVNHVHAHIHGALLGLDAPLESLFPGLALVVSGGHTNIYYMANPTDFELLAQTIDDACGESFDKVAKLFGLGYPGGPRIEALAKQGNPNHFQMPRMVEEKKRLLFSYSGLKTHMVNLRHRNKGVFTDEETADLCAAFQEEALGQLVRKLESALALKPASSILVAGGVAANQRFRAMVDEAINVPVYFPHLRYCSDNAAMIAALGYHQFNTQTHPQSVFSDYDWDAFSRYHR
ncbi:tRNA (adenosine(37)-N6)-threonylcarbamoyltransferase complex transferase subunit TsaD [Pseudobacteriovorax antillogorgiicola]|uniref:tRNA N6-adenosine threonylcarbamoyltransferase n=1 Tax=Pseudobacteriovorax antillogorgiicola TaxID=1513793 RepID=A0A1Y6CCT1_9BACT|nr:tRNA (adenosine(37)-N6)-threonylcarbamoyltransferase complex transferase subunit TsaD [Pseudobacteriovorax antillogorgiicola]TCS49467.1 N6-L-threonylcarbamoyladenine synthase [Pseudobacteriovorax antillogorgiicola]SMF46282.1 N6-L-threonylcarbamoyladenine synthase [Pseudobacteriovorax antillogorgiicola]